MRGFQQVTDVRIPSRPTADRTRAVVRERHSERYFRISIGARQVLSFSTGSHSQCVEGIDRARSIGFTSFGVRPGPFATVGRAAAIIFIICATIAAVALTNFRAEAQRTSVTIPLPDPAALAPAVLAPAVLAPALVAAPAARAPLPTGHARALSSSMTPQLARPDRSADINPDGDLDRALSTAFATGEFQSWTDEKRGLGGMVVVGVAEQSAAGTCRDVAIMTRGMSDSGHTENSRRCQDASGIILRARSS